MKADIETLARDNRVFGRFFKDVETWTAGLTLLKLVLGQKLRPEELPLVKQATGLDEPPKVKPKEVYVIAGRRSGKSSLAALLAVYMALFEDWKSCLSAGERPVVLIMAVDKSQAGIVKRCIEGILDLTPTLWAAVKQVKAEEIELRNGVAILIKPCSFRSIRGLTVVCAILEELAFWKYELESVSPDREVLVALRPSLSTTDGLIMAITTPYSRAGMAFETFKSCWGKSGSTLVWRASTSTMNPSIDTSVISRAMQEDPAAAEWAAEFRADISGLLDPEVIDAAVVPDRVVLPPIEGRRYAAFLDPSGGRADSFTVAVAHFDGEKKRAILDIVVERRPPFNPAEVVAEFAQVLKSYRISRVISDAYSAEWVSTAFMEHGIGLVISKNTKSELYLEALPRFNSGMIELLDNKRLVGQLKALERKARVGGRDQVDTFYSGAHDDLANSAVGALVGALDVSATRPGRVFFRGKLIGREIRPGQTAEQSPRRVFYCRRTGEKRDKAENIQGSLQRWRKPPDED